MNTRAAALALALCGAVLIDSGASAAPTAQEILSKSRAAMAGMRTYEATVLTTISGGPMTMTLNAHVKRSGPKTWAQLGTSAAGGAAAQNPFAAMVQNVLIVDDGTNTWTYIPAMKQYQKAPTGGGKQLSLGDQLLARVDQNMNLTTVGSENVGGRPAYVVEAKPKKAQPGQNGSLRLFFDQSTYHLVQAIMKQSRPARGQMPAQQQSVLTVVKDEKVNQPIPDSVFKFTPPAGAKEAQGGMGMGMGMRPTPPAPRK